MRTWKDKHGKEWPLDINVGSVEALKGGPLGVDLWKVFEGDVLGALTTDPPRLYGMLHALSPSPPGTVEDLMRGLDGAAQDRAMQAFMEELVDFFPKSRREIMKTLWRRATEIEENVVAEAAGLAETMDLEGPIRMALKQPPTSAAAPTSAPESAE